MSRGRLFWHKTNHDRRIRDPRVVNLPYRARGFLSVVEDYVGSTEEGYASGVLCTEEGARYRLDEFVLLMSRGDAAIEKEIRADLALLVAAQQLCPRLFEKGYVKLMFWEADQELATGPDSARKRVGTEEKLLAAAAGWGDELERMSVKYGGRRAFSDEELLSYIKARRNGYAKTNARFLESLIECGLCVRNPDGQVALASLAPDRPAGAGFAGAGFETFPNSQNGGVSKSCESPCVGAGSENFPNGKFPLEKDPEKDPEERLTSFQLDSAGGGGSGASEAPSGRGARRPSERPKAAAPVSKPLEPERSGGGGLPIEPGDAYRCHDPLRSSIDFLSQCPGWANQRYGDQPCSATVLRAKWRELRERIGPQETERIWRVCLDQAITDKLERHTWRTYIGIFLSRVGRQVEFLEVV